MDRYSRGAQASEAALCCPISYDAELLRVIPGEIIERDYGCGDPSQFVHEGDVVLDLGSGGGKICYIASQLVGPAGRVVGVDLNAEMLALAREHQPEVARKLGYDNVEFHRARIQDLALDLDKFDEHLRSHPVRSASDMLEAERHADHLRREHPLIKTESIDIVLSNCVLNLVRPEDKEQLFREIYRVLRVGGRAAISDIVSDEPVPERMHVDPELWSGCISGAYEEKAFLRAFLDTGFHGVEMVKRDEQSWQTVQGIEFRSVTVLAYKGKDGPCFEHNQAVVYRGPFSEIHDDDGHTYRRGERIAVCEKTYRLLSQPPYQDFFYFIEPRTTVNPMNVQPLDCLRTVARHLRETKGLDYDATTPPRRTSCCGPDETC
ncbi:MAG: methyltransferase domain-containing protein [Planctomycetes bacterium]|nr:methyltransferase domain-containing protein [Planctomycetota bacterium]